MAAALVQALSDEAHHSEEIDALRAAAAVTSISEHHDTLTLLRALATTRDNRVEPLHRIAATITSTGERSD